MLNDLLWRLSPGQRRQETYKNSAHSHEMEACAVFAFTHRSVLAYSLLMAYLRAIYQPR